MSVYRVYVEKKAPFAVEAQGVLSDIHSSLGIGGVTGVRILNRYDVEDITPEDFELAKKTILSEPQVDEVYDELPGSSPTTAWRWTWEISPSARSTLKRPKSAPQPSPRSA